MAAEEIKKLLLDYKRSGERWIGLEIERLVVREGRILHYDPDIRRGLESLRDHKGWRVDYEAEGQVLGLTKALHAISLEPGSQFEISVAPRKTVLEIQRALAEIDKEILSLEECRHWDFLDLSLNPFDRPEDRKLLPSPRYSLMDAYFKTHGQRGREMMRLTCGIHVNLDYQDEREGIEMLQLGFFIAPYLAGLFAHSPYQSGRQTKNLSERIQIWKKTDPLRSGFMEVALVPQFSLADYAEWVSRVPLMYAFDAEGEVFDPKGMAFRDLPENLKAKNSLPALRQIFTEARLKPCCVEIRSFDQVPAPYRFGAVALVVGLMYSDRVRSKVHSEFSCSFLELVRKIDEASRTGLKTMHAELCKLVDFATQGLIERGFGEEKFLGPVKELLELKKTPAELLIEAFGEIPDRQKILKSQI